MRTLVICKVFEHNELVAVHSTTLPLVGEPHFYRTVTSFDAVRSRQSNKWYALYKTRLAHTLSKHLILSSYHPLEVRVWEREKSLLSYDSVTEHPNLWELYQAVKYDYKKQKFIEGVPPLPNWL